VLVLVVSGALLLAAAAGHELGDWRAAAFAAAFAAAALLVWLTLVRPKWVREAGDAYATRLLESAMRVAPPPR